MSQYTRQRFPWSIGLEGREVAWGGWRWRFSDGVPRVISSDVPPSTTHGRWTSLVDAGRIYDLRSRFLWDAVHDGRIRSRRFVGKPGPGSPTVYVALADVAKIKPRRRGPLRRVSVRAEPRVGEVTFVDGHPVPCSLRGRRRLR